ncbi:hypothetical protein RhiirA4_472958 [Rhizophagus irregularis]|uniref:Uncharacterized protein n=1 Tax=Rhizophagus irregularis TaxID=588596 RepID=A0A2I1H5U9_9GLOM|nr:hypothetical protein RhiirA4_472958 [Rhizophagus irregularis]
MISLAINYLYIYKNFNILNHHQNLDNKINYSNSNPISSIIIIGVWKNPTNPLSPILPINQ